MGRSRLRRIARAALTYLGYLVAALIVMVIGIYVETNARDLELPLAGAGALIAIISGVLAHPQAPAMAPRWGGIARPRCLITLRHIERVGRRRGDCV